MYSLDLKQQSINQSIYLSFPVSNCRWKSENVSTREVSDALGTLPFIHDANVYGVRIPGTIIVS